MKTTTERLDITTCVKCGLKIIVLSPLLIYEEFHSEKTKFYDGRSRIEGVDLTSYWVTALMCRGL